MHVHMMLCYSPEPARGTLTQVRGAGLNGSITTCRISSSGRLRRPTSCPCPLSTQVQAQRAINCLHRRVRCLWLLAVFRVVENRYRTARGSRASAASICRTSSAITARHGLPKKRVRQAAMSCHHQPIVGRFRHFLTRRTRPVGGADLYVLPAGPRPNSLDPLSLSTAYSHMCGQSACMPRLTTVVGGLSAVLALSSTEHVPPAHEGSASIPGVTSPALFVALC
jgi:hypothetical protein